MIHFKQCVPVDKAKHCCRYSLGAACTTATTGEQLQEALKRTVQAEKDSIASAVVCLKALRMPDASTPVAELCGQGIDTLEAQMLTPPACSSVPGADSTLHSRLLCMALTLLTIGSPPFLHCLAPYVPANFVHAKEPWKEVPYDALACISLCQNTRMRGLQAELSLLLWEGNNTRDGKPASTLSNDDREQR